MLAKVTYKNQITIPKQIISFFVDTQYFDISRAGNEIIMKPVEISSKGAVLAKARQKIKELGLTHKDIEAAVRWARDRKEPAT